MSYSGYGSGTEADPYRVSTADQLDEVRDYQGVGVYWRQVNDISLSDYQAGNGWVPIGEDGDPFYGEFDGQNHSITDLVINRSASYQGLFGYVVGKVKQTRVVSGSVTGTTYTGLLCGFAFSGAIIEDCSATGSVTCGNFGGGLIGRSDAFSGYTNYITRCWVNATVAAGSSVGNGGLCGSCNGVNATYKVIVTDCFARGSITSGGYKGGLTGGNGYVDIEDCYSSAAVSSGGSNSGGLVGSWSNSTATTSYWDTETSGWATSAAGTGKTTADLTYPEYDAYSGWDFDDVWEDDTETENAGYPLLQYTFFPDETFGNPLFFGGGF